MSDWKSSSSWRSKKEKGRKKEFSGEKMDEKVSGMKRTRLTDTFQFTNHQSYNGFRMLAFERVLLDNRSQLV